MKELNIFKEFLNKKNWDEEDKEFETMVEEIEEMEKELEKIDGKSDIFVSLVDHLSDDREGVKRVHSALKKVMKKMAGGKSLNEGMSDKEIRDLAMKNLPNSGIPEELIEPAIKILIDGFRKMEYYDIDPKLPIEYQNISSWRLKEFQEIIEKMQISLRDLVDDYMKKQYKFR